MKPSRPSFRQRMSTPARRSQRLPRAAGVLAAGSLLLGCQCDEAEPAPAPAPSGVEQPVEAAAAPAGPLGNPTPVGPPLEVVPGKGIGPIRFGATFETVERHMLHPCDVRTETKCVYVKQAVEFTMQDGAVAQIQLHRRDRSAGKLPDGKTHYFGSYFGGLRPTIVMGLHRHVALEELRAADRVERLSGPNEHGTIERHHYPGLVIEFDRLANGNTVLGGFQILPAPEATSPALPAAEVQARKAERAAPGDGAAPVPNPSSKPPAE